MAEILDKLAEEAQTLKTLRDELRVQLDLGRMEARDLWGEAEKSWNEFEDKMETIAHETGAGLRELGKSSKRLLDEIGERYREIRKLL